MSTDYTALVTSLDAQAQFFLQFTMRDDVSPEGRERWQEAVDCYLAAARAVKALVAERDGAAERLRVRDETVAALNEALVNLQFKLSDADRRVEEEREVIAKWHDKMAEHYRYLADTNGAYEYLYRWHEHQKSASAIRSRSNATGEDKDGLTAPATGRSPISSIAATRLSDLREADAYTIQVYQDDDGSLGLTQSNGTTRLDYIALGFQQEAQLLHLLQERAAEGSIAPEALSEAVSFDVEKYVAEYVADHGLDIGSDCMLTDFANGMMWAIEQRKDGMVVNLHHSPLVQMGAVGSVPDNLVLRVGDLLMERVNGPEGVIYRAARDIIAMVLSASPTPPQAVTDVGGGADDILELAHALDWLNMQAFPGVGTLSQYMLIPKVEWDSINPAEVLRRYVKRGPELQRGPSAGPLVPGLEEANRIATEIGNDVRHTAGERAGARMVGAALRKQLEGVPTPSDGWARLTTADALKDPASVHINMVRGAIAIPSLRQYLHARGGGALETFERVVEIAARNESAPEIDKAKIMIEERLYEKEAPNEQK